jgi:hypothetical protein
VVAVGSWASPDAAGTYPGLGLGQPARLVEVAVIASILVQCKKVQQWAIWVTAHRLGRVVGYMVFVGVQVHPALPDRAMLRLDSRDEMV